MNESTPICMTVVVGNMAVRNVLLRRVAADLYRLEEEACLFLGAEDDEDYESFPRYGDVMKAESVDHETLRYIRLHERGAYRQFTFTLSKDVAGSAALEHLVGQVVAEGGHWERHMEGILFVALPATSSMPLEALLSEVVGEASQEHPRK